MAARPWLDHGLTFPPFESYQRGTALDPQASGPGSGLPDAPRAPDHAAPSRRLRRRRPGVDVASRRDRREEREITGTLGWFLFELDGTGKIWRYSGW